MIRIHPFIVQTKKADRKLRENQKNEDDPFGTKKAEETTIPKALQYASRTVPDLRVPDLTLSPAGNGATNFFRCDIRRIREDEGGGRKETREIQIVANFLAQIEWPHT